VANLFDVSLPNADGYRGPHPQWGWGTGGYGVSSKKQAPTGAWQILHTAKIQKQGTQWDEPEHRPPY
jgi:hypothetical protein